MPRPLPSPLFSGLLVALTCAAAALGDELVQVAQWAPHDFAITAQSDAANPFLVEFAAAVAGPDGTRFELPGFYDGEATWKIRVAPTALGDWSLTTHSEVPALDGKTVRFRCVASGNAHVHGVLRVDSAHPHHFVHDDGTRFFLQGYEYDWLWALDMDRPGVPTVEASLDILSAHGFNVVILNTYAHDTGWRKGITGPDDYGPPPLYAWEGDNENPDHSRMNLPYWQHFDKVIGALAERGMQAHLLMKVYNKGVNWPKRDSQEEKLFLRWLLARYAAYPNIIWDFSKEAHNEKDLEYKQRWLKWLRTNDPYRHLMTVHDDDKANDSGAYDALTDFRADQGHSDYHALILRQRARRAWPVANVESDYEHGPMGLDDKTYNGVHTPEELIRCAWEIAMAGGYNAYYYTYTAWDVVRPLDVPPGYALYKHFGDFWRGTKYWTLVPSDDLVSNGWCLARPGHEYVVFQNQARPFDLEIKGAPAALAATWFNPHTGARTPAGSFSNGTAHIAPPANWGTAPLVLHLRLAN